MRAVDYPFADLDISSSARSLFGAVRSARGVLVSALGEKKPVLVAPEGDFAALVEGRYAFPATPAQDLTCIGVVASPPIQGTPDPKPKRRSVKDAPWFPEAKGMPMTLSIPKLVREGALRAADRAGVLGFQLIVFITLAPNIDGLSPPERVEFWSKCLNRLRAYCCKREKKLGIPFPAVYLATRESDPVTHLGEHLHLLAHAPDRAEADHMAEVVRKWFMKKRKKATARGGTVERADGSVDGDAVEDPNAAHAKRVDTRERFRGGKLRSVARYLLKAANPQSWKFDSTILWKRSGAIAGKRVFISRNLTNRDVVAATRGAVEAVELARREVVQAGRDGFVPAPAPPVAPLAITVPPVEIRADPETVAVQIPPAVDVAEGIEAELRGAAEVQPVAEAPVRSDAEAIPAEPHPVIQAEIEGAAPPFPVDVPTTPAKSIPAEAVPEIPARPSCPPSSERPASVSTASLGSAVPGRPVHGRTAIPRRPRRGGSPSIGYTGIPPPGVRSWATASAHRAGPAGRARAPPPPPPCRASAENLQCRSSVDSPRMDKGLGVAPRPFRAPDAPISPVETARRGPLRPHASPREFE